MNTNPLVTVFCLSYNHAEYVVEALESVLNQTYKNIELIVADDCSKDNSVEVIEKWLTNHPEIQFYKNKTNIGNTKTINSLLKLAKGDYIIDMAADDVMFPFTVEKQLEKFNTSSFKNLGIVYGNLELIHPDGSHKGVFFEVDSNNKRINPQPTGDIYLGLLSMKNNICSVSSMVKTSVFKELNGYKENLVYEDFDFWIRVARKYEFDFIDEIIFKKRELPNSLITIRYGKFNKKTFNFNRSTYRMILDTLQINRSKEEDLAIFKIIYYELVLTMKSLDVVLFLKYVLLIIRLGFRTWFHNY